MQPAIHQEKNPDIYASMSGFLLQCIVGCIFYSVGLIIPRKSPCILYFNRLEKLTPESFQNVQNGFENRPTHSELSNSRSAKKCSD
jgi:hypothetical protein